jgi:hypothetical protein
MIRNKRKAKKDVAKYYICTECNADGVGEREREEDETKKKFLLTARYYLLSF